ncbi:MAG: helix-hairpin-helix domain-containing protein [Pyrinomonadaceae bacterium]
MSLKSSTTILIVSLLASACAHRLPSDSQRTRANSVTYESAININTATLDELQRIPHVGEKVAERIIEHRETHGPFRRVEHLMLIQGISDKRFRKIRPLVRVE